jgi:hypothetical protein
MRLPLSIAIFLSALPGCGAFHDLELYPLQEPPGDGGTCPRSPDMTVPVAKCAAAKGLGGDTLLCVDMAQVPSVDGLRAMNWIVAKDSMSNECWEIMGGKLQIKNFSSFADNCLFKLPTLNQNYSSFTLAVVHTVDLNSVKQKAQVMLGGDDEQLRLLDWMTGTQPRKKWVQTVAKDDLPAAAGGMFQPLFKLSSGAPSSPYLGWQIESIAVMGNAQ